MGAKKALTALYGDIMLRPAALLFEIKDEAAIYGNQSDGGFLFLDASSVTSQSLVLHEMRKKSRASLLQVH